MTQRLSYQHPRDELLRTMERIYHYRMTTTSGGNLSVRDANGDIWITPARVDKGNLTRQDMVRVGTDGSVEGRHPPSSELPFHRAIYQARPDVGGIVHAHPVALVAFSIVGQIPDTRVFHQSHHVCGTPGFAPYALPGSAALGARVAEAFSCGHDCVVLENHGAVVVGRDLTQAFQRFETFEFTAKTIVKAARLGAVRGLNDEQLGQSRPQRPTLSTFHRSSPSSEEKELRRQLRDFIRRGYQQRLFISTEGSFSARLGDGTFVITPYACDRHRVEIDDFVLMRGVEAEWDKTPSRAAVLHASIYERHPSFQAIVNAYPVNATAFCLTGAPLQTRTIPESHLFLRDPRRVPFGLQFSSNDVVASYVSPTSPVALLDNDGVLVCGNSVLDAFDRLEVLESTAEAILNSLMLGEVRPMSDAVISELLVAFAPPPT